MTGVTRRVGDSIDPKKFAGALRFESLKHVYESYPQFLGSKLAALRKGREDGDPYYARKPVLELAPMHCTDASSDLLEVIQNSGWLRDAYGSAAAYTYAMEAKLKNWSMRDDEALAKHLKDISTASLSVEERRAAQAEADALARQERERIAQALQDEERLAREAAERVRRQAEEAELALAVEFEAKVGAGAGGW